MFNKIFTFPKKKKKKKKKKNFLKNFFNFPKKKKKKKKKKCKNQPKIQQNQKQYKDYKIL